MISPPATLTRAMACPSSPHFAVPSGPSRPLPALRVESGFMSHSATFARRGAGRCGLGVTAASKSSPRAQPGYLRTEHLVPYQTPEFANLGRDLFCLLPEHLVDQAGVVRQAASARHAAGVGIDSEIEPLQYRLRVQRRRGQDCARDHIE